MLQRLQKFIEQHRLLAPHDHVLLGVSGGVDSVVLLHLLRQAGYSVGVAHCNFALRGGESDGDECFVRELCASGKLPLFARRFDTREYAAAQGVSIQMAARTLRYEWFEQLALEHGFSKVAVAHNLNDDVETFFLNLARGTGLQGLAGMAPVQGRVVRPLLFATREEVERCAMQHHLCYREDSSNSSTKYARNFIRHCILPECAKLNPSFLHTMQRNMARLRGARQAMGGMVDEVRRHSCTARDGTLRIRIDALPAAQRSVWLHALLREYGFAGDVVERIAQSLEGASGKTFHSLTHTLVKDRDCLIAVPRSAGAAQGSVSISQEEVERGVQLPLAAGGALQLRVAGRGEVDFSLGNHVAFLRYDALQLPLTLRPWRRGDVFTPLGMTGKKKLSDFFVDAKLSLPEKAAQLLLCSASGHVAWVLGRRLDNRFRVTPEAQKILRAELLGAPCITP